MLKVSIMFNPIKFKQHCIQHYFIVCKICPDFQSNCSKDCSTTLNSCIKILFDFSCSFIFFLSGRSIQVKVIYFKEQSFLYKYNYLQISQNVWIPLTNCVFLCLSLTERNEIKLNEIDTLIMFHMYHIRIMETFLQFIFLIINTKL